MKSVGPLICAALYLVAGACSPETRARSPFTGAPLSRVDAAHLQQALPTDEHNKVLCAFIASPCPTLGDDSQWVTRRDFMKLASEKARPFEIIPNQKSRTAVQVCITARFSELLSKTKEYRELLQYRKISRACKPVPDLIFGNDDDVLVTYDDDIVRPHIEGAHTYPLAQGADMRVVAEVGSSVGVDIFVDARRIDESTAMIVAAVCRPRLDGNLHPIGAQFLACMAAAEGMPCSIWCMDPANDEAVMRRLRRKDL